MGLRGLVGRWRAGRLARLARDYGSMSADERAEVDELREEHSPFRGLGRGGGGRPIAPQHWDDDLEPPGGR